ncbi:copper resistance protein NlpE [Neisseriaceae bacterium PsAf]|nr:copper resistance protein NlpE [Neisseriaceae bacterium PsAf]
MKKILLLAGLLSVAACNSENTQSQQQNSEQQTAAVQADTTENSLDWMGTYEGEIPCADCSGIKMTLTLNQDKTYSLIQEYQTNKPGNNTFTTNGTFTFNTDNPSLITLDEEADNRIFFIGENFAEMRDMTTGEKIESSLNYTLQKVSD